MARTARPAVRLTDRGIRILALACIAIFLLALGVAGGIERGTIHLPGL